MKLKRLIAASSFIFGVALVEVPSALQIKPKKPAVGDFKRDLESLLKWQARQIFGVQMTEVQTDQGTPLNMLKKEYPKVTNTHTQRALNNKGYILSDGCSIDNQGIVGSIRACELPNTNNRRACRVVLMMTSLAGTQHGEGPNLEFWFGAAAQGVWGCGRNRPKNGLWEYYQSSRGKIFAPRMTGVSTNDKYQGAQQLDAFLVQRQTAKLGYGFLWVSVIANEYLNVRGNNFETMLSYMTLVNNSQTQTFKKRLPVLYQYKAESSMFPQAVKRVGGAGRPFYTVLFFQYATYLTLHNKYGFWNTAITAAAKQSTWRCCKEYTDDRTNTGDLVDD